MPAMAASRRIFSENTGGTTVSMIQYLQTSDMRKWQILALVVLAFLAIIAVSYFTLHTIGHVTALHQFIADASHALFGHPSLGPCGTGGPHNGYRPGAVKEPGVSVDRRICRKEVPDVAL